MRVVVEGTVVEGDHRGRELGFPTANLMSLTDAELPEEGVYAGITERADGTRYQSAISVGRRATFYGTKGACLVETYLLDFDGDLYGEMLRVEITDFIRSQQRFDSVNELIAQIRSDVATVRKVVTTDLVE